MIVVKKNALVAVWPNLQPPSAFSCEKLRSLSPACRHQNGGPSQSDSASLSSKHADPFCFANFSI